MADSDVLREQLHAAARLFRLGQEGAGSDIMVTFTDLLAQRLADGTLQANPPQLLPLLISELVAGQERGDFLWVADLLEYELSPLLGTPDDDRP